MASPIEKASRAQQIAADPRASVWVTASAGTGKTKVLTDRILRLLLAGTPPDRLLCLTFTRAAATEMANRLQAMLARWAILDEAALQEALTVLLGSGPTAAESTRARQSLARLLDVPGGMRIQTIHAFCQSILARFPLEAGVPPHFAALDERAAKVALSQAETRIHGTHAAAVIAALARLSAVMGEDIIRSHVVNLIKARGRLERVAGRLGGWDALDRAIHGRLGIRPEASEARLIAAAVEDNAFDGEGLRRLVRLASPVAGKKAKKALETMAAWLSATPEERRAGLDSYRLVFFTLKDTLRDRVLDNACLAACPEAAAIIASEADRLGTLMRTCKAIRLARTSSDMITVARRLGDAYEQIKRDSGRLDFDDLIDRVETMLGRADGMAAWVLYKLDEGIDHILVDEAQDTNRLQWRIIEAIANEFFVGKGREAGRRTVFAVGDAKQSIYRFQGADADIFDAMRGRYQSRVRAAAETWRQVPMNVSFRSAPPVLRAVDAMLAATSPGPQDAPVRHFARRAGAAGLVEVWPVMPAPEDAGPEPWKPPVEQVQTEASHVRLARLLADKIAALCEGERLESRGRAIAPGDIMVLVRRRNPFVAPLVRALKEKGVPVAGADRMMLIAQIAVMDLIALGRFLLMPDDDLTLAVVLKSPVCGLDDDDLFALAFERRERLWTVLRRRAKAAEAPSRWRRAVERLAGLLKAVDYLSPYALYADFLGPGRGRHDLLTRLGPDAADPIDEFLNQALTYQHEHPASLEGFLHWLENGDVEVKRDLEQGGGAVRVMTVHGAKGLQAPIVFLPDTVGNKLPIPGLVWDQETGLPFCVARKDAAVGAAEIARDAETAAAKAEYQRLLYVAMTRAEDRLYVCGWGAKNRAVPEDCWYTNVRTALSGLAEAVDDPFLKAHPLGPEGPVLRLQTAQSDPVPTALAAITHQASAPPRWLEQTAPAEPSPPTPLAPTALGGDEPAEGPALGAADEKRLQRGKVIHTLLQWLPELAPGARIARARAYLAQPRFGLDEADQAALAEEAVAVIEDPACAAAFGPGSRAEVDLAGLLDAGAFGRDRAVLAGRVDRLVVTEAAVHVIDFKSGAPPARVDNVPDAYRRQMAAYCVALRRIFPDRPVHAILIWTEGPSVMPLPQGLVDEALLDPIDPGS